MTKLGKALIVESEAKHRVFRYCAFAVLGPACVVVGYWIFHAVALGAGQQASGVLGTIDKIDTRRGLITVRVPTGSPIPLVVGQRVLVSPATEPTTSVWGVVDPAVLGTCSSVTHDRYLVDGGDGFFYRTWHPLIDPAGCSYAHEHGDDPNSQTSPVIRAKPIRFGYAARRMPSVEEPQGHAEAHEGYKVFVVNRGQVNDEGRTSLIDSRVVAHMGTSAPKRFVLRHHSLDFDVIDSVGKSVSLRLMGDTGDAVTQSNGSDLTGCDVRPEGAGMRMVVTLHPTCKQRPYEFWTFLADVAGLAQVAVATAAFDPLTARDPNEPLRVIYLWDQLVDSSLDFPGDDRTGYRGCDREHYSGPVYWRNTSGQTSFLTDAMGQPVSATDARAIRQEVSAHDSIAFDASIRNGEIQSQFKLRRNYCGPSLGLKN